ncbi:MAG: alpha/beta fold hydrolase, partial [Acidobacteria bacterium]|nr:alpha/beta fold hydrolase [Acidobacteriota bacterium]
MRRIHALRSLLLLLCLAPLTAAQPVEGLWSGTLEAGVKLRLVLRVKAAGPGKLTATLQSVDQGVTLPVSAITLDHQTVAFEVQQIGGSFKGTLNLAASEITGQWSQMGAVLPLIFTRTARAPEAVRPQEPKPPFPYEALEVSYENREANVKLAGTLTVPRTKGPFPAVLLITCSGPQDRNETIVGHKPFLVIADYLTRRGIAVLRVDDRGVGGSTGNAASATIEDFAADVLDGIAFLKQRKEIDATRIGLLGHSEGGVVAPLVASKSKDVAFLVLLAAPGVTGEQLLYAQGAAIARTLGASAAGIAKQQALQQKLFAAVKQGGDPKSLRARLEEMIGKQADPDEGEPALQRIASSQTEMLLAPGFRYFLT